MCLPFDQCWEREELLLLLFNGSLKLFNCREVIADESIKNAILLKNSESIFVLFLFLSDN